MGPSFVEALPVGKFHGIGPATSAKMNGLGIFTGMDIRNQTLEFMNANFGKSGAYYYWISRGVDDRPVRANGIRKSIGAENTFSADAHYFRRHGRRAPVAGSCLRQGAPDRKTLKIIENASVVYPGNATLIVREHRLDGSPFIIREFAMIRAPSSGV